MRTLIAAFVFASAAFAQHEVAPAEQTYKNITALKGTPSDQIGPAMQFISAALGVNCEFCHVQGKFEADDKNAKKTARAMIEMQNTINQNAFRGQRQVTCYSCHRGNARPAAVPPVLESDMPMTPPLLRQRRKRAGRPRRRSISFSRSGPRRPAAPTRCTKSPAA